VHRILFYGIEILKLNTMTKEEMVTIIMEEMSKNAEQGEFLHKELWADTAYRIVKLFSMHLVSNNEVAVCECEAHSFYEWEKEENKCCQCNKPIFKQTDC